MPYLAYLFDKRLRFHTVDHRIVHNVGHGNLAHIHSFPCQHKFRHFGTVRGILRLDFRNVRQSISLGTNTLMPA